MLVGCVDPEKLTAATARGVVHAVRGDDSFSQRIDETITISANDGTSKFFTELTKSNVALGFDKRIRADAIPADAFTKSGVG